MLAHAAHWLVVFSVGLSAATGAFVVCLIASAIVTPIADRLRLPFARLAFAAASDIALTNSTLGEKDHPTLLVGTRGDVGVPTKRSRPTPARKEDIVECLNFARALRCARDPEFCFKAGGQQRIMRRARNPLFDAILERSSHTHWPDADMLVWFGR
jgi:hypothetical protein